MSLTLNWQNPVRIWWLSAEGVVEGTEGRTITAVTTTIVTSPFLTKCLYENKPQQRGLCGYGSDVWVALSPLQVALSLLQVVLSPLQVAWSPLLVALSPLLVALSPILVALSPLPSSCSLLREFIFRERREFIQTLWLKLYPGMRKLRWAGINRKCTEALRNSLQARVPKSEHQEYTLHSSSSV